MYEEFIETSSTLGGDASFTSVSKEAYQRDERAEYIIGTVYADQPGELKIQFDDGSGNWDGEATRGYTANKKLSFKVPIVSSVFRVVYENGSSSQGTFRLNTWMVN